MLLRLSLTLALMLTSHAAAAGLLVLRGGTRIEVDRIVVTGHRVYAYPAGGGLGVAYDIDDVDLEATRALNAAPRPPPAAPEPPSGAPDPAPRLEPPPSAPAAAAAQDCQTGRDLDVASGVAVLTLDEVEIHASADPSSPVIGLGHRCDALTLVGARGRWCIVRLASGEDRFVSREACAGAQASAVVLPDREHERRSLFTTIQEVRQHAAATSERLYPAGRKRRRHARHRAQLEDRYVLEILHQLGLSPAALPALEAEAEREGWDRE